MPEFQISLSAYQTWQQCEQKYFYRYVRRLRPHIKDIAMERGSLLHEYLGGFYSALKEGASGEDAHQAGKIVLDDRKQMFQQAAFSAHYAGDEETAIQFTEMIPSAHRLADFYYDVHGRTDADRFEVILVEKSYAWRIAVGVRSISVIDLVLRDRETERTSLVEHKTTKNVPPSSVRIRDLQTVLYAELLLEAGIVVDSILWNYLRTKEPAKPHQNKDGKFSRAVAIDTTWKAYEAAIREAGQDPEQYADVRDRLQGREFTEFFPRYEYPIIARADLLLHDYVVEAARMRQAVLMWRSGQTTPVRTITRNCDFCEFYRVCEAAIVGGDEESVIQLRFKEKGNNG